MNGPGAVPESGVKNGEVGDRGPGENVDADVSVKALFKEVLLWEWKGARWPANSRYSSGLSTLRLSWLFALWRSTGDGDPTPFGDTGEVLLLLGV